MKTKVNLGLNLISIPDKIQNARIYADNLDHNPSDFPNANPASATLRQAATDLEVTYGAAQNGTTLDTANMHDDETVLDAYITKLSHYVEDLPNCTPALIILLGMKVRAITGHSPVPFNAKAGAFPGSVGLHTPATKSASYYWEMFQGASAPADNAWQYLGISTITSYAVAGLASETKYWFRVVAITGQTRGAWSTPVSIMVL